MNRISIALTSVIIIAVSLIPQPEIKDKSIFTFEGADKVVHFLMYAFLMFIWIKSESNMKKFWIKKNYLASGLIYCFSLGLILEILQYFMFLGRSLEFFDIIANFSGTLSVFIFFKIKKLYL
ncbi:MAG: VanZ family protein [Deltaproteobacteria bacterium]